MVEAVRTFERVGHAFARRWLAEVGTDQHDRVRRSRPRIPADIDARLLWDTSAGRDLSEGERVALRDGFWRALDEQTAAPRGGRGELDGDRDEIDDDIDEYDDELDDDYGEDETRTTTSAMSSTTTSMPSTRTTTTGMRKTRTRTTTPGPARARTHGPTRTDDDRNRTRRRVGRPACRFSRRCRSVVALVGHSGVRRGGGATATTDAATSG